MNSNLTLVPKPISSHTSAVPLALQQQTYVSHTREPHLHRYEESLPHPSSAFSSPEAPPLPPPPPLPLPHPPPDRRRGSKTSAADSLRSASVCAAERMQDGTAAAQDASAASLAEKKRNKLGYHRTSVACVHCRRRKIRCLVDTNDPQGRCQNCIRLKKECNFYPVDQQPPNERQRRPVAKSGSQASTSPAPPSQAGGESFAYPPPPMGYPAQMQPVHGGQMPIAPLDTGFAPPNRSATWDASYMDSPMSPPGAMSEAGGQGYWGPYSAGPEATRSAQFSPTFSQGRADWQPMHHSQHSLPVNVAGGQPGQQVRSMSLQHDGQGMYGGGHVGNSAFYDASRGTPSLQASTGSPATSVSLSDATTAPGQNQPAMHYGMQPGQWDPKDFGGPAGAMGSGWYPDPAALQGMPDDGSHAWQSQVHNQGGFKPA